MECYGKQIWTNLTKDTLHELGIDPPDEAKYKAVKARWDAIAKPLDGMGRFEEITAQIGAVTGDEALDLSRKAVLIFCADNGIVAEGVSQSGQEVTFAFVNPFSEHKEEACEYLADAWQLVDQGNKIMFSPNESEPVLNSYYEENLKSANNSIADLQKTLDKTEDEEARESLQNDLDSMKEWLTEYEERGKYDVSPEQIEIYRAFGDNMTVQESLIWNMDDGASQIQQYLDGAMNAQQLAGALEKTLQMQKLAGN